MKNMFTSVAAMLLVIWYSLSVIGFDVHTCSSSGQSYIATVISGTDCDDIHPEHAEKTCPCCHHHKKHAADENTGSIGSKSCCSDDWQVISLTGTRLGDEWKDVVEQVELSDFAGHNPLCSYSNINIEGRPVCYKSDPGNIKRGSFHQVYCIWRI